MVWTAASVYTQIIINVGLGCMNPKPNISELILEAMTHSSSLCHGYVAGLDVLLKRPDISIRHGCFSISPS